MLLCIKLMFKIKRNNIYLNQFNTLNFGDILLVGFSQLFVWSYQNNFRDFGDTFPPAILSFLKVLYILNAKVEYPISTISRLQTMTKKHIVRERVIIILDWEIWNTNFFLIFWWRCCIRYNQQLNYNSSKLIKVFGMTRLLEEC